MNTFLQSPQGYVTVDAVTAVAAGYGSYKLFGAGHKLAGVALAAVALLNVYYLTQDIPTLNQSGA